MVARLFNPDEEASISLELSGSPFSKMGFRNEIAGICESNLLDLQRFVRTQFLSIPRSSWTVALKDLIACQVTPCLHVTTSGWSGPVVAQAREIAEKLSNQKMDTLDSLNLKLGCAVAAGCLDKHPLIQGVLVAAVEKARRLEKNVQSMKGLQVSSLELAKMSDAGITLSFSCWEQTVVGPVPPGVDLSAAPIEQFACPQLARSFHGIRLWRRVAHQCYHHLWPT